MFWYKKYAFGHCDETYFIWLYYAVSDENKPKLGFSVSESGLEDALDTKTFTVTRRDGSAEHPTCLGFGKKKKAS